jgi:regulatory protein
MRGDKQPKERQKRAKVPLDQASLRDLAMTYVAKYATSATRLERYLKRKLRERGWVNSAPQPDIAALVARFAELGYVDDAGYARMKSASLLRRGYGRRRIGAALGQDGIAADLRDDVAPSRAESRHAVLAMARKRRFGPFGSARPEDRQAREKQVAALLRAGHDLDSAREIVDAADIAAAEEWATALDEDAIE